MISIAAFIVWAIAGAIIVFDLPVQAAPLDPEPPPPPPYTPSDSEPPPKEEPHDEPSTPPPAPKSAFRAQRLTPTTFLIVETDDIFGERPYVYAKRVPAADTLVLLDTGCGGRTRLPDVAVTSLRVFLESVPVADNGAQPLNPGGHMRYVIVLSHCHYDHILGIEDFDADSLVLESAHDPPFVSCADLPAHSQCARLGVRTPSFTPTLVAHGTPLVSAHGAPLGLTLLHTPGHTPDELALWDAAERMLFVGDTLYERAPIIFPPEGDLTTWFASVRELIDRVRAEPDPAAVRICCGHETAGRPALDVLCSAEEFIRDVVCGRERLRSREQQQHGMWYVEYMQDGGRYSLICPERLVLEARQKMGISVV